MNKSTYFFAFLIILGGCILWGNQTSTHGGIHMEMEAEDADSIHAPFEIGFDSGASGGGFIIISKGRQDQIRRAGKATFNVFIEDPNVVLQIWIRAKSEDPCVNSFYLSVDGKRRMIAGAGKTEGGWIWIRNADMSLEQGRHTVEILAREESCLFDKIILTNKASFAPI